MCFTYVISHRCAVSINFNAAADIRHIKILLRVTESVGINNLHRRGITPLTWSKAIGAILEHHQGIAINQLVAKGQTQHLWNG